MLTFLSVLLDCEELVPQEHSYEDGDPMGPCGWMMQGRLWMPQTICALQEKVDYSTYYRYHFNDEIIIGDSKDCDGLEGWDLEECQNYNDNAKIDLSYVHVGDLGAVNYDSERLYFGIMEVREGAEFANAILNITATIDLSHADFTSAKEVYVSPFQSVDGTIRNVSIFGTISIVGYEMDNTRKLVLSNMFGDIGDTADFSDIRSGLRYVIDGQDYEEANFGQIVNYFEKTDQSEEEPCTPCIANPGVPAVPDIPNPLDADPVVPATREMDAKIQANIERLQVEDYTMPEICEEMGNTCYTTEVKIYNRIKSLVEDINVTTLFDRRQHPNAFTDFYTGQVSRYLEFMVEIANLTVRQVPPEDEIASTPQNLWLMNATSNDLVLYTGETKTVIWKRGSYIRICDGAMLYDMIQDKCIPPSFTFNSCPHGARFLAMCVQSCPRDYIGKGEQWHETNMSSKEIVCYPECPKWLGWTEIPAEIQDFYDDTCVRCPGVTQEDVDGSGGFDDDGGNLRDKYKMLLASDTSCEAQCTDRQYMFGSGCYPYKPAGSVCEQITQIPINEEEKPVVQNFCYFPKPIASTHVCPTDEYLALLSENIKLYSSQYYPSCRLFTPGGMQPYTDDLVGQTIFIDGCRNSITGEQQIDLTGKCDFTKLTNEACFQYVDQESTNIEEEFGEYDQGDTEDIVANGSPRWLRATEEEEASEYEEEPLDGGEEEEFSGEEEEVDPYADKIIKVYGPKEVAVSLSRCRAGCINNTVNASGICSCSCNSGSPTGPSSGSTESTEESECPTSNSASFLAIQNAYTYPQPKFGRCNPCLSSYDGGSNFNFKERRCTRLSFCGLENCSIDTTEECCEEPKYDLNCDPETECCVCLQAGKLGVYEIIGGSTRVCRASPCPEELVQESDTTRPDAFKNCLMCPKREIDCPCGEEDKFYVDRVLDEETNEEVGVCVLDCPPGKIPAPMSPDNPLAGFETCQECIQAPGCHCESGYQNLIIKNGIEECVEKCPGKSVGLPSQAYPGCYECSERPPCEICETGVYKLESATLEVGSSISKVYFEMCTCECPNKFLSPVYENCYMCGGLECPCLAVGTDFMTIDDDGMPQCMAPETTDCPPGWREVTSKIYTGCRVCEPEPCPYCPETNGYFYLLDPSIAEAEENYNCTFITDQCQEYTLSGHDNCYVCETCKCRDLFLIESVDEETGEYTCKEEPCAEGYKQVPSSIVAGCYECEPIPAPCPFCQDPNQYIYMNTTIDGVVKTDCMDVCPHDEVEEDPLYPQCRICSYIEDYCPEEEQIPYPVVPGDSSFYLTDVDCVQKVHAGTHVVIIRDGKRVCEPKCRMDQNLCMVMGDNGCQLCDDFYQCLLVEEVVKACQGKTFRYLRCVPACNDFIANTTISYDKLNPEMSRAVFHNKCVAKCPADQQYVTANNTCTKCENGFIVETDLESGVKVGGGMCEMSCDLIELCNGTSPCFCLKACPAGWFQHGKICVASCPEGMVVVGGICMGSNKTAMWIYIVIALSVAFLIVVVILLLLLMKKKRVGIQRIKRRQEHSGKTVYYSNKIKQNVASAGKAHNTPLLETSSSGKRSAVGRPKTRAMK